MIFVLILEKFTKSLSLVLVLSLVITLRLGGGQLKCLKPVLNMDYHVCMSYLPHFQKKKFQMAKV